MGQARVREILMQIFKIVVIVFFYDWAGEGETLMQIITLKV